MSGTIEQVENPLGYDPAAPLAAPAESQTLVRQWLGFLLLHSWIPDNQASTMVLRRKVLDWSHTLSIRYARPDRELVPTDEWQHDDWQHGWLVSRIAFAMKFQKISHRHLTGDELLIDIDELRCASQELSTLSLWAAERCGITLTELSQPNLVAGTQ